MNSHEAKAKAATILIDAITYIDDQWEHEGLAAELTVKEIELINQHLTTQIKAIKRILNQ